MTRIDAHLLTGTNSRGEKFFIYQIGRSYRVDSGSDYRGTPLHMEFPRTAATIAACKAMVTRITGDHYDWEPVK